MSSNVKDEEFLRVTVLLVAGEELPAGKIKLKKRMLENEENHHLMQESPPKVKKREFADLNQAPGDL